MRKYGKSLKAWRKERSKTLIDEDLLVYLDVYAQMLECLAVLHRNRIIHFDLKCDNFFLDDQGKSASHSSDNSGAAPSIDLCLGDFGESMIFSAEDNMYTTENRGTEFIRSPEMLLVGRSKAKDTYDRRRKHGASLSSDVWSIGCGKEKKRKIVDGYFYCFFFVEKIIE